MYIVRQCSWVSIFEVLLFINNYKLGSWLVIKRNLGLGLTLSIIGWVQQISPCTQSILKKTFLPFLKMIYGLISLECFII